MEFTTTTLTGNYQLVEVGGLEEACVMVNFINDSANTILVSYDGANDHDVILPHESCRYGNQTNNTPAARLALFAKGQQFWIKSDTSSAGDLYITGFYL